MVFQSFFDQLWILAILSVRKGGASVARSPPSDIDSGNDRFRKRSIPENDRFRNVLSSQPKISSCIPTVASCPLAPVSSHPGRYISTVTSRCASCRYARPSHSAVAPGPLHPAVTSQPLRPDRWDLTKGCDCGAAQDHEVIRTREAIENVAATASLVTSPLGCDQGCDCDAAAARWRCVRYPSYL